MFDFTAFPDLYTERLLLREPLPRDAEDIFAFRADPDVTRLNIGAPYYRLEQAEALISAIAQGFRAGSELRWVITFKDDAAQDGLGRVIGMVGYNYWNRHDRRAQVGYDLARAHWGAGLMTEALAAVVRFGFAQMDLNRIEADCSADNIGSVRVLEKLGFQREGVLRDQYYDDEDHQFHDLLMFALLRRESTF